MKITISHESGIQAEIESMRKLNTAEATEVFTLLLNAVFKRGGFHVNFPTGFTLPKPEERSKP